MKIQKQKSESMNHTERFRAIMNFQRVDRLPNFEWAMWWDETIKRWKSEGFPQGLNSVTEISDYFGLDPYVQFWISTTTASVGAEQHHVEGSIKKMDDYLAIRPHIFPEHASGIESMRKWSQLQDRGDAVVWLTIEGFFWFPRTLLGLEQHIYAFYDQPELTHCMNSDLANYHIKIIQKISKVCRPTFMTFAEDMSYNHGPMLSKKLFDEFLAPYYLKVMPVLKELDIIPIIDTDGDVTEMIPWLMEVGIEGILPLERQAGVDISKLRSKFPTFKFIGHYDKMVMPNGEQAMREEFERLLPAMRQGGFIPSVDHQTPPGVSLDQYKIYVNLLNEYCEKAAR
jgi:hypothetical protein